ncbi:hypothetical protein Hypma_007249 [Hypsizygus marmoreus]|uniref:Metallo-beta-lactamase domain-containing protein n=1 Tax=Hypsizygus marmoreus TaxID=39966 RepID=A0A369K6U8_HYPMA|nr:hypothetical protein Hypma_007249 [Hypsizygus marmoreus]
MSETVIREVANNVWTFSRPFARFGLIPFGGRSTAIKMRNGGVWLLASTPLEQETKSKLDELGPIQYIIGADAVHHLYLSDYKRTYPNAKLIAPKEAIERHDNKSLVFDGVWGTDPEGTEYGFEDEIKACFFSGFKNKDVAFFHPESKILIEADLLFNLPPTEQYSKSTSSPKLPLFGSFNSSSWLHPRFLWSLGVDKDAMRRDAKTVAGWDFEKIIPCHGDVIEKDGKKAWLEAYKFYLD